MKGLRTSKMRSRYNSVLTKTGISRKQAKQAETRQKEPKLAKTSRNDFQKMRNDPKRLKISKLGKSGIF